MIRFLRDNGQQKSQLSDAELAFVSQEKRLSHRLIHGFLKRVVHWQRLHVGEGQDLR